MAAKPPSLDSLLECPICLNECDDPRKMPCGNTLCCKCLTQHMRRSATGRQFFCPTCRQRCEVPEKGATAFPNNYLLNSLKEREQHEAATPTKCDQHSNLTVDMYCDTCSIPVCMKCCLWKHKAHAYRDIAEASKESKTLLSTLNDTAKKISSRLNGNLKQLDMSERNINRDCDEACRQVRPNKNPEESRSLVAKKEESVVHEIRQAQGRALAQLNTAYKEAQVQKAVVDSLVSYIDALLASEDAAKQMVQAPGLQEQLRQHQVVPLQYDTLKVNLEGEVQSLSALTSMLGAVSVSQSTLTNDQVDDTDQSKSSLGAHLLEVRPKVGNRDVSGLVMMRDCVYVTGFSQPYLKIYNLSTNTEKQHKFRGLRAAGMTRVHGDTLVITDYSNRLHRVKTNQDMEITEHKAKAIPFEPSGVCVDPAGENLIIANNSDHQIVVCDVWGNIKNRIKVKTSIQSMRSALATTNGYIILYWSGELCWLSQDGAVEHTYDGDVNYGRHAVQDSKGRVIIADDYNNRVHLLGVNKQLSHYLLTGEDGIKYPTCLCLEEANARLAVGCRGLSNKVIVRMYKWPGTLTNYQ